jgi:hypothetical protein
MNQLIRRRQAWLGREGVSVVGQNSLGGTADYRDVQVLAGAVGGLAVVVAQHVIRRSGVLDLRFLFYTIQFDAGSPLRPNGKP